MSDVAAGGVGLTAVQYALRLGALVYATAGKEAALRFVFVNAGPPVFLHDPDWSTGTIVWAGQAEPASSNGCDMCGPTAVRDAIASSVSLKTCCFGQRPSQVTGRKFEGRQQVRGRTGQSACKGKFCNDRCGPEQSQNLGRVQLLYVEY